MSDLKQELLEAKLALFCMIDQFMYEVTDETGAEYFDDYCESAGEHAFAVLGFEGDRISKEEFYRRYDDLENELRQMYGNKYTSDKLGWYIENKIEQCNNSDDTFKTDIVLRLYGEELHQLGFENIPSALELQAAIYDAIETASKQNLAKQICETMGIAWNENATKATLHGVPVVPADIGRAFNAKVQFD